MRAANGRQTSTTHRTEGGARPDVAPSTGLRQRCRDIGSKMQGHRPVGQDANVTELLEEALARSVVVSLGVG
jgi:hypothetical protein